MKSLLNSYLNHFSGFYALSQMPVLEIIPFGSQVEGFLHPHSDLDIMIILRAEVPWKEMLAYESWIREADRLLRERHPEFSSLGDLDLSLLPEGWLEKNIHPASPFLPCSNFLRMQNKLPGVNRKVIWEFNFLKFFLNCSQLFDEEAELSLSKIYVALIGEVHYLLGRMKSEGLSKVQRLRDTELNNAWISRDWKRAFQNLKKGEISRKEIQVLAQEIWPVLLKTTSERSLENFFPPAEVLELTWNQFIPFYHHWKEIPFEWREKNGTIICMDVYRQIIKYHLSKLAAHSESFRNNYYGQFRDLLQLPVEGPDWMVKPSSLIPRYMVKDEDHFLNMNNRRMTTLLLKGISDYPHGDWVRATKYEAEAIGKINPATSLIEIYPAWTITDWSDDDLHFKLAPPSELRKRYILEKLNEIAPDSILEIGGTNDSPLFSCSSQTRILIVNPDPSALSLSTGEGNVSIKNISVFSLDRIEMRLVLASEVIEHLELESVRQLFAVLENSQSVQDILMTVPNKDYEVFPGVQPRQHPDHKWVMRPEELKLFLNQFTAFEVVSLTFIGGHGVPSFSPSIGIHLRRMANE